MTPVTTNVHTNDRTEVEFHGPTGVNTGGWLNIGPVVIHGPASPEDAVDFWTRLAEAARMAAEAVATHHEL